MAEKLNIECPSKYKCKFETRCVLINPVKVCDPNDAGGDFWPIWQIRTIKNTQQLRCFSFAEKERGNG